MVRVEKGWVGHIVEATLYIEACCGALACTVGCIDFVH